MAIDNIREGLYINVNVELRKNFKKYYGRASIIRCIVSLRSDLSVENPTLPESELECEIYDDSLIEGVVADLPDETAITYTAYGDGDEYFTRYFYTDEVRWENNILYIHARDQVHKLDEEIAPLYIGQVWYGHDNIAYSWALWYLNLLIRDIVVGTPTKSYTNSDKIEHFSYESFSSPEGVSNSGNQVNSIIERGTRREIIAKLINLCRFDFPDNFFESMTSFYLNYVDAGRPKITWSKPTAKFDIYEEDCGDLKDDRQKNVTKYNFRVRDVLRVGAQAYYKAFPDTHGTAFKYKGISAEYTDYADITYFGKKMQPYYDEQHDFTFLYWNSDVDNEYQRRSRPYTDTFDYSDDYWVRSYKYGMWLYDKDVEINAFSKGGFDFINLSGSEWTKSRGQGWSVAGKWSQLVSGGYIDSDATETELDAIGLGFQATDEKVKPVYTGRKGVVTNFEDFIWNGEIYAVSKTNTNNRVQLLPDMGLVQAGTRTNLCGSFIHRSIQNLQPRDVFRFHFAEKILTTSGSYLQRNITDENDNELEIGGYEDRTVENHTITHENGGSISEITYRRGIV